MLGKISTAEIYVGLLYQSPDEFNLIGQPLFIFFKMPITFFLNIQAMYSYLGRKQFLFVCDFNSSDQTR